MLNCKQKIKHLKAFPDHKQYLLTSTQYASELKISELAYGYNKLIKKSDGEEFMISPFAPVHLPSLKKENIKVHDADNLNDSGNDQQDGRSSKIQRTGQRGSEPENSDLY